MLSIECVELLEDPFFSYYFALLLWLSITESIFELLMKLLVDKN